MIKAVFFDWFNTLARYNPPREVLQSQALKEFGYDISPEVIFPAILLADTDFFEEQAVSPVTKRSREEQSQIYTRYQQTVLNEVGISTDDSPGLAFKVVMKAQELYKDIGFALFDDVLPELKTLRKLDLKMGLLTNMETDMNQVCENLGLGAYLDFIVTSVEAGADKPDPRIFALALERTGVKAEESLHVGDQPVIDAQGAKNAGINPVLIDRFNQYPDVTDYPRISSLVDLGELIR
ncbi:HAD family hydrolase [Chloroflexota bacterium]